MKAERWSKSCETPKVNYVEKRRYFFKYFIVWIVFIIQVNVLVKVLGRRIGRREYWVLRST